jgi:hypothetical protein
MALADLQRSLAASLAGRGRGPEALDEKALEQARRSLIAKRRRAAGHLLPRLRAELRAAWLERFTEHAARYTPSGLLYHVDDAWELAVFLIRDPELRIAAAARDDLVALRLHWVRRRRMDAARIRERRGPLIALIQSPTRTLVVRLPGSRGKMWRVRV